MRKLFSVLFFFLTAKANAQLQDVAMQQTAVKLDTAFVHTSDINLVQPSHLFFNFTALRREGKPAEGLLGHSKKNKPIPFYFFPGRSSLNALVIGGVHGSELSAIEVVNELVRRLREDEKPSYNVVIIPQLFPDNATSASNCACDRHQTNSGRYTYDGAIDPNRQLPALGKPFYPHNPVDAFGREVEKENALLLQLIQALAPQRIVSLHAIKEYAKAGVYADPRTDCRGRALGYSTDSLLAVKMASYIAENGGNVPGNKLRTTPTALYYLDPKPSPAGSPQPRNLFGANNSGRITGVSLGSWASTAVCDDANGYHRPAMRLITMEFPGYKKPSEYETPLEQSWFAQQVLLYAGAIYNCFLQDCVAEDETPAQGIFALK